MSPGGKMEKLTPQKKAERKRIREVADQMRARLGMKPVQWVPLP